jgi:hypothetical protein
MDQAMTALGMLLEGMSIRAVERLTGLHRDTICELILVVGENCQRFLTQADGRSLAWSARNTRDQCGESERQK